MKFKKSKEQTRESSLTIPMSDEEKDTIRKKADEMGLTMSSFVRLVLKDFFKKEEI